jgi:peptidoglycan/LPS O-acetylase OafA/YrhL
MFNNLTTKPIVVPGHLPNLNAFRFFAAATVMFYHVDVLLVANKYKSNYLSFFPFQHGDIAVVFFFVLSGFLITYLLLIEKEEMGSISIRKFYLKRVFRIWPLYFLVVILSFSYFNYSDFFHIEGSTNVINIGRHLILNVILLILICPNGALINTISLGYANPTWSIGVEEQFYLIWPWLLRRKNYLAYIFVIIISIYLLSNGIIARAANSFVKLHWIVIDSFLNVILMKIDKFFTFSFSFRIDAMGLGAIGAHLFVKKSSLLKILYATYFQIFNLVIFTLILLLPHQVPYQFYAVIFMIVILNIGTNPKSLIQIKSRLLNYLGKISYGIYMFHLFLVFPAIHLVGLMLHAPVNIFSELLICVVTMLFTVAVAAFSYNTFEKIFLTMKGNIIHNAD